MIWYLFSVDHKWKWKAVSFTHIVHPWEPFAAVWVCGEDARESRVWGMFVLSRLLLSLWTLCFRSSSVDVLTVTSVHSGHCCGRPFCLLLPQSSLGSPPQHFLQLHRRAALAWLRVLQEPHFHQGLLELLLDNFVFRLFVTFSSLAHIFHFICVSSATMAT